MTNGLRKTLSGTKFRDAPIVPVSANVGAADILADPSLPQETDNLTELVSVLRNSIEIPRRSPKGDFLFAIDHCFGIVGKGTVVTGTVLKGSVAVGDVSQSVQL